MIGRGGRSRSDRLTLVDHLACDKGSKRGVQGASWSAGGIPRRNNEKHADNKDCPRTSCSRAEAYYQPYAGAS